MAHGFEHLVPHWWLFVEVVESLSFTFLLKLPYLAFPAMMALAFWNDKPTFTTFFFKLFLIIVCHHSNRKVTNTIYILYTSQQRIIQEKSSVLLLRDPNVNF